MDLFTSLLRLACSGGAAYIQSRNMRDPVARLYYLMEAQQVEYGAAEFIKTLSKRATAEGDIWLAKQLDLHAIDEEKHGKVFGHALEQLTQGKKIESPKRNPFYSAYLEGYSQEKLQAENIDWVVFMGSMYVLEQDSSREFVHMANALPEDNRCLINLKKGMMNIAQDEKRHAGYLYEAMQRRMGRSVELWIDQWRTRQVQAILTITGEFIRGTQRPLIRQDGALFSWS
ncbi:MAG: ferritin-like domain-containing protein [Nostoc sp.]|uniref:ferritin-like domain-containing protein n=1 Tax=Nostoc sp. TaxID=1180 RepID=UPI002FF54016